MPSRDSFLIVIVLECGLNREGLGTGVLDQDTFDIDGVQVAPKGYGTGSDDGKQGQPQSFFETMETKQGHFQD